MADIHAIRQALATTAAGVSGINKATADTIESAADSPCVLVLNTTAHEVEERGVGYELRRLEIAGLLVLSRAPGLGAATESADDLVEALFVAYRQGILLGMAGTVQDSWLARAEQDSAIEVGKVEHVGYRLAWSVKVRENVTRSA